MLQHTPILLVRQACLPARAVLVSLLSLASTLPADTAAGVRAFEQKQYATAYREWKAAAEQGQAEAQFHLGLLYLKGLGVSQDLREAFRLLRSAADQGHVLAQFQVGRMRERGWGVRQDFAEAQQWYHMAAVRGDAEAESGLAALYEEGYGVQQDLALAVHWYRQAAEQGFGPAQARLGACYALGRGVTRDLSQAYLWLTLAAKHGEPEALKERARLVGKMTPESVATAERLAAEWKPAPRPVQATAASH